MTQFQMSLLPDWYSPLASMHSLFGRDALIGDFYRAGTAMMRRCHDNWQTHAAHRPNDPYLLKFLTMTEAGGQLRLDPINRGTAPLFVANAAAAPRGSDLWHLPAGNERLCSNAPFLTAAKPLTLERLAAGGCPAPLGQPVFVDGEWQSDGAYLSNPNLGPELLDHIAAAGAELLLIRSRPAAHDDPFNQVTNRQVAQLRQSHPALRLAVIEPLDVIVNPDVPLPPGLDFSRETTSARRAAGWQDAQAVLQPVTARYPVPQLLPAVARLHAAVI